MEKQKGETAEYGDPWWIVFPGLTIEGTCTNDDCKAGGKQVLCEFGMGEWEDVYSEKVKCPMCKEAVKRPWEPWFYECNYRCNVTYKDIDDELKKKGDVKDGDYHHYDIKKDVEVKDCKVKTWPLNEKENSGENKKRGDHTVETCSCACTIY